MAKKVARYGSKDVQYDNQLSLDYLLCLEIEVIDPEIVVIEPIGKEYEPQDLTF